MDAFDQAGDADYVFGSLMVVANRTDTMMERALAPHGVTARQWYLLLVLLHAFGEPPTLKETAVQTGTSYQNVKQVALKLEEKGLLHLVKDKKDKRVTRLVVDADARAFWKSLETDGARFMKDFYEGIPPEDLRVGRSLLGALMRNLSAMEERQGEAPESTETDSEG
jgi:MarR family transcriptional regulator, transcriptional regulator for hemolysin